MSLRFFLTNGDQLAFNAGLPSNYSGHILKGAESQFATHKNVDIVVQRFSSRHITVTLHTITWRSPERLIIEYDYPPSIFLRTLFNNYLCEIIKGLGDFKLDAKHFYAITGSKWCSLIEPGKAGDYYLLDLTWNIEGVHESLPDIDPISLFNPLPRKLIEKPCCNSASLHRHFEDLIRLDYSSTSQQAVIQELMNRCLTYVTKEINDQLCIKKTMKDTDWHYVMEAKRIIHESLHTRLSTPDISVKIGVNRERLKKVFKMATGYGIDEYRKYQLFVNVARELINSQDAPLKSLSVFTGYDSESSMVRAFKSAMFCTPGELRTGEWDLSRLNGIPETKWETVD